MDHCQSGIVKISWHWQACLEVEAIDSNDRDALGSPVVFTIYTPILEKNTIEIISNETTQNQIELQSCHS